MSGAAPPQRTIQTSASRHVVATPSRELRARLRQTRHAAPESLSTQVLRGTQILSGRNALLRFNLSSAHYTTQAQLSSQTSLLNPTLSSTLGG